MKSNALSKYGGQTTHELLISSGSTRHCLNIDDATTARLIEFFLQLTLIHVLPPMTYSNIAILIDD